MTIAELKKSIAPFNDEQLQIKLPDGELVPAHFHVTEVAFVKKDFIDCGGTIRHEGRCQLQVYVADDVDHRIPVSRFLKILDHGGPVIPTEQLPVEVEVEYPYVSNFPIESIESNGDGHVTLILTTKHTDCLDKDVCGIAPKSEDQDACCAPGSGCC
ncbi:MAG: DUF6428 family protein [Verrucomicrobiota bacterium JB023]|nr:DUF6428 family protein [Verrucomicrobiota bacterium JB023]